MNWEVQLYVSGKVFYEYVIARDYQDAKLTALSRNPTARVISITAKPVSYTHLTLPTT